MKRVDDVYTELDGERGDLGKGFEERDGKMEKDDRSGRLAVDADENNECNNAENATLRSACIIND